jgi:hypothetical protein
MQNKYKINADMCSGFSMGSVGFCMRIIPSPFAGSEKAGTPAKAGPAFTIHFGYP